MATFGKDRLEKILQITISDIITMQLTNSNLSTTTITAVELSNDKSHLKVFVTFDGNELKSMEALKSATGFIKRQISMLDGIRKVPTILFKVDKSFAEGQKIERLLSEISKKEKK